MKTLETPTSETLLRELVLLELGLWSSVGQLIAERPLFVLGHACDGAGCGEFARYRCFWPGQTCVKCAGHCAAMEDIAAALGFSLVSERLEVRAWPESDPSAARFAAMELY